MRDIKNMKWIVRGLSALVLFSLLQACADEEVTSEQHFNNAKSFLEQSDQRSATIELKNALRKDINNTSARALLGKIYFEVGDYASAD